MLEAAHASTAGGHTGVFHAWLSDATGSAYDRMLDVGPWYNTSDEVVFASKSDLRGAPAAALLDEYGDPLSAAGAWTGTSATGEASGHDCEGWTNAGAEVLATTGTARDGDQAWGGGAATSACNGTASLICFQQP